MPRSTMIHEVKGTTGWYYYPDNGNLVGFTIQFNNGDYENVHLFGMKPEVAKDFYQRNTTDLVVNNDKERISVLEKALERITYENVRVTDIGSIAKEALEADPEHSYVPF